MKGMAETKETKTKAQRALEAKAKYQQLLEDGKAELLETANQTLKDLAELGFVYHLIADSELQARQTPKNTPGRPKGAKAAPKTVESPTANYNDKKRCEICHENGHDGRQHRLHKERFTNEELAERGLLPPELPIHA